MEKKGWKILTWVFIVLSVIVLFLFVLFYYAGNLRIQQTLNEYVTEYNKLVIEVIGNCREYFCTYEFNCPEDEALVIKKCNDILGELYLKTVENG